MALSASDIRRQQDDQLGIQKDVGQTLPVAKKSWSFHIDSLASAFAHRWASTSTLTCRLPSNERRLSGSLVLAIFVLLPKGMQSDPETILVPDWTPAGEQGDCLRKRCAL